jgi:cytosine/adenosine deaminase-related metal-dependent hydrolase
MLGNPRTCPVSDHRAAGVPVGLGCDGSASADSASLWTESRNAMLVGKMRDGPERWGARDALELATLGGARCLGRQGELGLLAAGSVGDLVCWPLDGVAHAGALSDPVEAWLRCGPSSARHTVVAGTPVVADGRLVSPKVEEMLAWHRRVAHRIQAPL